MRILTISTLLLMMLANIVFAQTEEETNESESMPNLIPMPAEITCGEGSFPWSGPFTLSVPASARETGEILSKQIMAITGGEAKVVTEGKGTATFRLDVSEKKLGKEGYLLRVDAGGVDIVAGRPNGLFYAGQTLIQLMTQGKKRGTIPFMEIRDVPRFSWRGMHLDVARHFFPVAFVKKYIDEIAMHKMNVLHMHLTDDQGWRVEIKKYPKLVSIGSKRAATPIPANRKQLDGKPYEGHFTQAEIREMVTYAKARFVTVVPEIEMPGHSMAAVAAYPEYSCTGGPFQVRIPWGISQDILCAGKDETFTFLEEMLSEVIELFPSEFIHIGGDEAPKRRWQKCPDCQKRIKDEGLKDEHELQSWFVRRIDKWLNDQGRRLIGWDEILEGGLAPNATVMSWRGVKGGIAAAIADHDVVMTPSSHCYLNHYQSKDKTKEPPACGAALPLERVYSYEPVPDKLPAEKAHRVLGAQGNVWTEYIPTPKQVEYMAWPRGCALAERTWSPKGLRDYADFRKRLAGHLRRFDVLKINYRPLD